MKHCGHIAFGFFLLLAELVCAQPLLFRQNARWGVKENEKELIPAVYDTIFNFDRSGKVCLACHRSTGTSANKFIKVHTVSYACAYLNRSNQRLAVKMPGNDTCTVFSLSKQTVRQFTDNPTYFVVSAKNRRNLVDRDFNQVTFKGYHEIMVSPEPSFIIVQSNETGAVLTGLINLREEQLIPFQYTEIKINTMDSLIIACSAGVSAYSEDDIYNYEGKKLAGYRKHVDMVTKSFVIHKLYEPKEYYLIYNIATKEEKMLTADEATVFSSSELLIRIKNDRFLYDMVTNLKKPYKQS